jgi:hypothetical protein
MYLSRDIDLLHQVTGQEFAELIGHEFAGFVIEQGTDRPYFATLHLGSASHVVECCNERAKPKGCIGPRSNGVDKFEASVIVD